MIVTKLLPGEYPQHGSVDGGLCHPAEEPQHIACSQEGCLGLDEIDEGEGEAARDALEEGPRVVDCLGAPAAAAAGESVAKVGEERGGEKGGEVGDAKDEAVLREGGRDLDEGGSEH